MEQSSFYDEKTVRHKFDRKCKLALKGEVVDYERHLAYLRKHEVLFSELSEREIENFSIINEYALEKSYFRAGGYDVVAKDALLAEALKALTERKRDVILLSYFMEMNDADIARKLNLVRSTVHENGRNASIRESNVYYWIMVLCTQILIDLVERDIYFWGTIFGIEFLLDILHMLNALPLAGGIDTVYSFWQMLSWIGIVFLTIYDLFSFFYLNKDRMLHILPISKYRLLWMKAIVFGTYMLLFFVVGMVRYLIILPDNAVKSLIKVGMIYLLSKMVAIFSFLSLLIMLLLVIKKINNSVFGAIIMASLFVGIVGAQAYGLFHVVSASHDITWTIGIVDGARGMNQYANILPIVFTETDDKFHYVEDSFYIISVWLNIGISIISFIVSRILFKTQRFNYIEK